MINMTIFYINIQREFSTFLDNSPVIFSSVPSVECDPKSYVVFSPNVKYIFNQEDMPTIKHETSINRSSSCQ